MTSTPSDQKSIVVERDMAANPAAVWYALTISDVIKEWLMENDFQPKLGQKFNFRAEPMYGWNGVTDCEVVELVENETLAYRWNASGDQAEGGLKTTLRWTLAPSAKGTLIKMEHAGFRPQDEGGFQAMNAGWPRILAKLEEVAAQ